MECSCDEFASTLRGEGINGEGACKSEMLVVIFDDFHVDKRVEHLIFRAEERRLCEINSSSPIESAQKGKTSTLASSIKCTVLRREEIQ
jgi:hypothetical protein